MKVTFEFEYPYQLVDLLEVLTKSAIERHAFQCVLPEEPEPCKVDELPDVQ